MRKIEFYEYSSITPLKDKQKKKLIIFLISHILLLILGCVLFVFMNRNNYIYLSIIIAFLLFYVLCAFFLFFSTIYGFTRRDIKLLELLDRYEDKTNHILSFEITNEKVQKFNHSFYVCLVKGKNKDWEVLFQEENVELIKNFKIEIVTTRNRVLTCVEGSDHDSSN